MIDFKNYAGIPLSFGRGVLALLTERGKVKPVDCPTVDDRPCVLKSCGRKKREKRGGVGISEAHVFRHE